MNSKTVASLRKYSKNFACVVAFLMVAFHSYTTATLPFTGFIQAAVHLCFGICVVGLCLIAKSDSEKITLNDICICTMMILALIFNMRILIAGGFISAKITANLPTVDAILAVCAVVSVLIATYYAIGAAMVWVAVAFIAYAFVGPWLPSVLMHNGIRLKRLLTVRFILYKRGLVWFSSTNQRH